MDDDRAADDGVIHTPRLDLVPFSVVALEALIDRDAAGASEAMHVALPADLAERSESLLRLRLGDLRVRPEARLWYLRAIALRSTEPTRREFVGLTGFHGPPDASGGVEVGYEVEPAHRRQGIAVEATHGLLRWAFGQPGMVSALAAIRADNEASLGVVRRLGFRPAGSRWDALEGVALLYERRRS